MTRDETKELLMTIQATYPNFRVKAEEMKFTINAWHMILEEYPYQGIQAALQIYVKTNNSGFAPSISQLINAIHMPADNGQLSEGEAWALVKKAIQDGNYHAEERFNELPEVVQKAVGSPNMIHQWAGTDSGEVNTVIMSNFQRAYKTVLQREQFNERVPEALSKLMMDVTDRMPKLIERGEDT